MVNPKHIRNGILVLLSILLIVLCGCGYEQSTNSTNTEESTSEERIITSKHFALGEMSFNVDGYDFKEAKRGEELTELSYTFTSEQTGKDVIVIFSGYSGDDAPPLKEAAAQLCAVSVSEVEETAINVTNFAKIKDCVVKQTTQDVDQNTMYVEEHFFICNDLYWILVQAYNQEDIDMVMEDINTSLRTHNEIINQSLNGPAPSEYMMEYLDIMREANVIEDE